MQIITEEQFDHLFEGGYVGVTIVVDTLHDGQITLTQDNLIEGSLSVDRNCVSSNNIEIGNAETAELKFELDNNEGDFTDVQFEGARLTVTLDIDGEPLRVGYFTVDEPPKKLTTMTIKALDDMARLNRPYTTDLNYPATLQQILIDACSKCNVTLYNSTFTNSSYSVSERPEGEGLTYHNIVSFIAELAGCNAYIDWNGALRVEWYGDNQSSEIEISADNRFSYDLAENDIQITGIVYKTEEVDYIAGSDDYALVIENNPLLQSNFETIINSLYTKLGGFVYRPYSFETLGFPHLWPMDVIANLVDAEENILLSVITNHHYVLNGNSKIKARGETETIKGYATGAPFTSSQQRVLQRVAQVEVERQTSSIEQTTLQLNQLMANALGFYETIVPQPSASFIKYIHDSATLEGSQNIWKYDSSGFAWTDQGWQGGSPVWQSGVTADGSMVMKNISTVGIEAEWINAQSLSSISANLGIVTAGEIYGVYIDGAHIVGALFQTSSGNDTFEISGSSLSINYYDIYQIYPSVESQRLGPFGFESKFEIFYPTAPFDSNGSLQTTYRHNGIFINENQTLDYLDYFKIEGNVHFKNQVNIDLGDSFGSLRLSSQRIDPSNNGLWYIGIPGGNFGIGRQTLGLGSSRDFEIEKENGNVIFRNSLILPNASGLTNHRGIEFPNNHVISVNQGNFVLYGNRSSGFPLEVRSHTNGSNTRSDFRIHDVTGQMNCIGSRETETGTSPNMTILSSGNVARFSSSIKYKKDIEDLWMSEAKKVLDLRPVWFRQKNYSTPDEIEGWSRIGLIAEEVNEIEPRLVDYRTTELVIDEEGKEIYVPLEEPIPEGVQYSILAVYMLPILKKHEQEIHCLKQEIEMLKNAG